MKRKISIILSLILVLVMATPVFAAVSLDVNGRAYQPSSEIYLENGSTLVPLDVITNSLGCTASAGDNITLQENSNTVSMTIGSTAAVVNGANKNMPLAPRVINGQTYVPLRFVLESLGASVDWNGDTRAVSINYKETRSDMTAEEMMAKASVVMTEANRYKMVADMQTAIDMAAAEAGQEAQNIQMDVNSNIEAWLQMDPMVMYMKQTAVVEAPDAAAPVGQTVVSEMVLNQDGMFMTMPEIGWVKMDMAGLDIKELMKQSMTQDPASALQQMKDMGMSVSFGQDQEKNGKQYWVMNATMGGDVFKSDYFKQFTQQMPSLDQGVDMQQLFENMDLDFVYDIWIDQATYHTDYMNLDGTMRLKMDIPAAGDTPGGAIDMGMTMKAVYTISDYGQEFTVPEIKDARSLEEVIAEQLEQAEAMQE